MQRLLTSLFRPVLEKTKSMRLSQLAMLPVQRGSVLFLGDSITEQGMWHEWFPDLRVANRGVGSDTVTGVLKRAADALNDPVAISLLIGTNDLAGLGASPKVADIADHVRNLVRLIGLKAPNASLVINSVMPRTPSFASQIRELNQHYRTIAQESGAAYLDLWPALADGDRLRRDYSTDSLHLNGAGYAAWVDLLRPVLPASSTPAERAKQPGHSDRPGATGRRGS